jgi:hypothetical protein
MKTEFEDDDIDLITYFDENYVIITKKLNALQRMFSN